jgi:hypothetical protein
MAKWIVELEERRYIRVEVDADSWEDAQKKGYEYPEVSTSAKPLDRYVSPVIQLGEPWLRWMDWYDLHGPGDVVCAEPAYGNTFTQADVDLLKARIETIDGLKVADNWNGAGCGTVSFRVTGRKDGKEPFTSEQRTFFSSPRE